MLFDIIGKESYVFNKNIKKEIDEILFCNTIRKIVIGFDMVQYLPDLMEIIGDDYKNIISAISECEPGYVKFFTRDNELLIVKYIESVSTIKTDDIDKGIIIDKPDYLIMNRNTLVMLSNAKPDNIDDYLMNKNAYYHSYNKVPIAICEFLETGKIQTVKELSVRT